MRTACLVGFVSLAVAAEVRHDASAGLEPVFRQLVSAAGQRQWIGYAVDSNARGGRADIFFRAENGSVTNIRVETDQCCNRYDKVTPDHWLTGVRASDSLRLLDGFVQQGDRKLRDGAVAGVAMHADAAAEAALERYIAPASPEELRKQAAFWLGVEGGSRGYEALARMLRDDPSEHVREHVTFALSRSEDARALPLLLETIRTDKSVGVRKQAMFWLAQSKDPRATAYIDRLLAH